MMRGKRTVNYRPVCFFALCVASGIVIAEAMSLIDPLYLLTPFLALLLCGTVFLFIEKIRKFAYLFFAAVIGLLSLTGFYHILSAVTPADSVINDIEIQCTADSEIVFNAESGTFDFTAKDVYIGGHGYAGKASVRLYTDKDKPDFGAGDLISVRGSVRKGEHEPFDTIYASNVGKGRYYSIQGSAYRKLADGKPDALTSLRLDVKRMFCENTDTHTAGICIGLLFGDQYLLDGALLSDIRYAGLAHVLAVSGLHVTAVAAALYHVLKKLRVKARISFLIVGITAFLYVALCGFPPSAIRAFIMYLVFSFGDMSGYKRDGLSSLSFAAALIMIFRPVSLMNIGFLLSVFAMLGIMLFYRQFQRAGMRAVDRLSPKRGMGKSVSESCSLALSANIGTFALSAYFFGWISVFSLPSSVIAVPYIMLCYIVLLALTPFALITGLGGLTGIMRYLLAPLKAYVYAVNTLPVTNIPVAMGVIGIAGYTVVMLVLSRFVFLTRAAKAKISLCTAAVCAVLSAIIAFAAD